MSKTAKVFLISSMGADVDFMERCIASRYKLINRGRKYTIDNAFESIQQERPDVIIVNQLAPMFWDSHAKLICDINEVENYSPEFVVTYCIPEEEEKKEQTLEKIHSAGVKYAFNLRNLKEDEFKDKLKCIIEE